MLEPVTLTGQHVALLPLAESHHDALCEAVQDGALWTLWYTRIPSPDGMRAEITRRLRLQAEGSMLPFAVAAQPGGRIVGMTTYMNVDLISPRVEIGSTWYAASVQRSALNTEAKLLLLTHAFETLGCLAVEFRTHFLNQRSRCAIERLGARLDGTLRYHQRAANGIIRDTCVYSITAPEWLGIQMYLRGMLKA